jgi:hypothetical protein
MDIGDAPSNEDDGSGQNSVRKRPRALPPDLPKSLDDRRFVRSYAGETEMYDAWQGKVGF